MSNIVVLQQVNGQWSNPRKWAHHYIKSIERDELIELCIALVDVLSEEFISDLFHEDMPKELHYDNAPQKAKGERIEKV